MIFHTNRLTFFKDFDVWNVALFWLLRSFASPMARKRWRDTIKPRVTQQKELQPITSGRRSGNDQ